MSEHLLKAENGVFLDVYFGAEAEPSRRNRIDDKIARRVEIKDMGYETPCHVWTGPTSGSGRGGEYGRMNLDGSTVAVHIAVWTNEHGLIPPRKQLDHLCSVRRCCREDHLELLTHKQNQRRRDAARKLRAKKAAQWTSKPGVTL